MANLHPPLAALGGIVLFAAFMLGFQVFSIVRDTDTWLIARGMTRGKVSRFCRALRKFHRG